jgi:hypothetical protein
MQASQGTAAPPPDFPPHEHELRQPGSVNAAFFSTIILLLSLVDMHRLASPLCSISRLCAAMNAVCAEAYYPSTDFLNGPRGGTGNPTTAPDFVYTSRTSSSGGDNQRPRRPSAHTSRSNTQVGNALTGLSKLTGLLEDSRCTTQ